MCSVGFHCIHDVYIGLRFVSSACHTCIPPLQDCAGSAVPSAKAILSRHPVDIDTFWWRQIFAIVPSRWLRAYLCIAATPPWAVGRRTTPVMLLWRPQLVASLLPMSVIEPWESIVLPTELSTSGRGRPVLRHRWFLMATVCQALRRLIALFLNVWVTDHSCYSSLPLCQLCCSRSRSPMTTGLVLKHMLPLVPAAPALIRPYRSNFVSQTTLHNMTNKYRPSLPAAVLRSRASTAGRSCLPGRCRGL